MWTDPRFVVTVIVLTITGVYDFMITILLMHDNLSQIETNLIFVVVGVLNTGGFAVAVSYWLGSSKSSTEKDGTIASQAEALKK